MRRDKKISKIVERLQDKYWRKSVGLDVSLTEVVEDVVKLSENLEEREE